MTIGIWKEGSTYNFNKTKVLGTGWHRFLNGDLLNYIYQPTGGLFEASDIAEDLSEIPIGTFNTLSEAKEACEASQG